MRRSNLILCALVGLTFATTVGCGGSGVTPSDRLTGKWELSTEQLRETMKEEIAKQSKGGAAGGMPEGISDEMLDQMVAGMKMSIEFQKDGKVVIDATAMGQDRSDEGTWEVVSSDGNKLTVKITTDEGGGEPGMVTFIDDDTIELSPPKGKNGKATAKQIVTMKRVK